MVKRSRVAVMFNNLFKITDSFAYEIIKKLTITTERIIKEKSLIILITSAKSFKNPSAKLIPFVEIH